MKRVLVFSILSLCLMGCTTTQTSSISVSHIKPSSSDSQMTRWKLMVGKWYGEQPTKDGGIRKWIDERFSDGTNKIDFRYIKPDGITEDSSELGLWGISGPVYFTTFRGWLRDKKIKRSDPSNPYNYDAYRIIQLNNDVFEYEHYTTGNHFTVKRVESDFKFD